MRLHVTSRQSFRNCRKRYYFSNIARIKPKHSEPGALEFGSAIHAGLAAYYRHDRNMTVGLSAFIGANVDKDVSKLGQAMLNAYRFHWEDDPTWEVQEVEKMYSLNLTDDLEFVGTIDLLVNIKGELWIVDHKTAKSVHDVAHLELDDQVTSYLWLLRQNGVPVKGFVYNVLLKKCAEKPAMLKSGELSRALKSSLTYASYMEAIEEWKLDPDDYEDVLQELKHTSNPFFHRFYIRRSNSELDTFEKLLADEVKELTREDIIYYPNFGSNCAYCPYQPICKIMLLGGDVEQTMKLGFRDKEDNER